MSARPRVCFLYIAQKHQVLHSLSIAHALARGWPDIEVENAATLIADLRQSKPWLFAPAHSSNPARPPPAAPPRPRNARDMTEAEWRAARAELVRRR